MQAKTRGFTLVELLVVVAIIAVLLALLVPALDKAIYQAELAACGARIKGIANAALTYAAASQRLYPTRVGFDAAPTGWEPTRLMNTATYDERIVLRPYLPINTLQCPLAVRMDLEDPTITSAFASYSRYFGIKGYPGHKGMRKLGDRWTWTDNTYASPGRTYALNAFVGDHDVTWKPPQSTTLSVGAHPDADGKRRPRISPGANRFSDWTLTPGFNRGTIEMNFASDDAAVLRYNKVSYDDDRMAKVPFYSGQFASGQYVQVPK